MKNIKYFCLIAILSVFVILNGCSKKEENKTDVKKDTTSVLSNKGKEIFYKASAENNVRCADCHSDGTNSTNLLTNYFPDIKGANKRISTYSGKYKGQELLDNAAGATICWQKYLLMKTLLTDEEIMSLNSYYASVSAGNEPNEIAYKNIALPDPDKAKLKEEQRRRRFLPWFGGEVVKATTRKRGPLG